MLHEYKGANMRLKAASIGIVGLTILVGAAWSQAPQGGVVAVRAAVPKYEVDPFWLKIPAKWVIGPLGGSCIDAQDHLFILHRQEELSTLTARDRKDEMTAAPPVMEFDPMGNLVNSWGD